MSNTSIERKAQQQQEQLSRTPRPEQPTSYFTPLVDIVETNEAFLFQADLPGVKPDGVDIQFNNGVLTIDAKVPPRQPQNVQYLWREYGVGHFHRSFTIDTPIDADGIKAELTNGVLSLYVPKAANAKTRKIKIQTS